MCSLRLGYCMGTVSVGQASRNDRDKLCAPEELQADGVSALRSAASPQSKYVCVDYAGMVVADEVM